MRSRIVVVAVAGVVTLSLAACGGGSGTPRQEAASEAPASTAASTSHEGHAAGASRVFFVRPKNGETIKTNTTFEFGSEGYQIAAVPQGTITPEQVRPGMGHYHLGVDTDCVPAGQEIPRGAKNWIHFGDGKNQIEMSLTPGPHKFSLQMGDDLHRAVEGLCETINVTVE